MKKVLTVILIIVVLIVAAGAGGVFWVTRGLEEGMKVEVADIDPSSLKDGVYIGEYEAGRWSNKLEVSVSKGQITDIRIIKDVMIPGEGAAADLFARVIKDRTIKVDAVSGATITSKAYLKAIENALTEGGNRK
ncbi:MAG: FMN-binding protein [Clostridiales bacterium]|nr:FMN-binding protein [Clostridiales bacterium]